MYSQQRSENPIRTTLRKFPNNYSQVIPTSEKEAHSRSFLFDNPIRSVFTLLMAVILFVGFVMGAYCIEGAINVGFTPDFQNNSKSYSTANALFGEYDEMVTVNITIHGVQEISLYTPVVTVGEIIDKLSLTLDTNDTVNFPNGDEIYDGMEICIDRVETTTHSETVTVPYTTKIIESQTIPKGTRNVIQKGVDGSSTQSVTQTFVNGELQKKDIVTEAVHTEAVEEIVEVGVGGTYTDINGNSYAYSYYIDVTATAYGTLSGITATGKPVQYGMIAVDPTVIPLGTKVYLTGSWGDMGVHAAEDTGGAIKGNKIDVFLGDDYDLLRQFGRRSMRVYILA